MKETPTNEEKLQMKQYFVKEKTQMKKTNIENLKEVTHEGRGCSFALFVKSVS